MLLSSSQLFIQDVSTVSINRFYQRLTCCLFVVEINCQQPVNKPHATLLWDGSSHRGSVVFYQCEEGFHTRSLRNFSVCGENGQWEDINLSCEGAMFDDR